MRKALSLILALILAVSSAVLFSCGESREEKKQAIMGTWTSTGGSSDSAWFYVFGENGYWNIFFEKYSLAEEMRIAKEIEKDTECFESFESLIGNNDYYGRKGCSYLYNIGDDWIDKYYINDEGNLASKRTETFEMKRYSDKTEPDDDIKRCLEAIYDKAVKENRPQISESAVKEAFYSLTYILGSGFEVPFTDLFEAFSPDCKLEYCDYESGKKEFCNAEKIKKIESGENADKLDRCFFIKAVGQAIENPDVPYYKTEEKTLMTLLICFDKNDKVETVEKLYQCEELSTCAAVVFSNSMNW